MGETIQFLFSIDVEPDEFLTNPGVPGPWSGTRSLLDDIAGIRESLSQATGRSVNFTWCFRLDPQIEMTCGESAWPLVTFADSIDVLQGAGDAFGVHPHAWRWDTSGRRWYTDVSDPSWVEHCVRVSLDTFERWFGHPCRIHRFGDRWIDDAVLDLLERLGVCFDLSVEPGWARDVRGAPWETFRGVRPDLRDAARLPYWRPFTGQDSGTETDRGLWMVPLSTAALQIGPDGVAPAPVAAVAGEPDLRSRLVDAAHTAIGVEPLRRLFSGSRRARAVYRRAGRLADGLMRSAPRVETAPLNLVIRPDRFAAVLDSALAAHGTFVHAVLRSGDLARADQQANARLNLAHLAAHPQASRFRIATPEVVSNTWTKSPGSPESRRPLGAGPSDGVSRR